MVALSKQTKLKIVRLDQNSLAANGLSIQFSASFSETYDTPGQVTSHPVESGSTVSDHVIVEPDVISVEAAFSGNPMNLIEAFQNKGDQAAGEFAELKAIHRSGEFFRLETGTDVYDYAVIESIGRPRDKNSGGVWFVNLNFREIRFATSQDAEFKPKSLVKAAAQKAVQKGKQATTTATTPQAGEASSLVKILKGFAG